MTRITQILLAILLLFGTFTLLVGLLNETKTLEKKTTDRIGCSDIAKIFPEKEIDCEKIQIRFNK